MAQETPFIQEKHGDPQERLKASYALAQKARQAVRQELTDFTPSAIATLDQSGVQMHAQELSSQFRPALQEGVTKLFVNYAETEKAIDNYLHPQTDSEQPTEVTQNETSVKKQFFDKLFSARNFSSEDKTRFGSEISDIQINRNIHGALAFENISTELFQRLTVADVAQSDEKAEPIEVALALVSQGAGFVDSITELFPSDTISSELPGVDVVFIQGKSPDTVVALEKYEENKIIEKFKRVLFKQSVPPTIETAFEKKRIPVDTKIQHALVDRANHLAAGESLDYLVLHGITPEYLEENPDQVKGAKLYTLVSQEISKQLDTRETELHQQKNEGKINDEQFRIQLKEKRQGLIDDIENTLYMEQLLSLWTGVDEVSIRQSLEGLKRSDISAEDFYGKGLHGKGLLPPKDLPEGYYFRKIATLQDNQPATLLEKVGGNPITYQNVVAKFAGGMGGIYKAEDPTGKSVAIKEVLNGDLANPSNLDSTFTPIDASGLQERQVGLAAEYLLLKNAGDAGVPHLPRVYGFGPKESAVNPDWMYMVQEWCDAPNIQKSREVVDKKGNAIPWSKEKVCRFGIQLFDTLYGLREVGILHKDIKDENVLLSPAKPGEVIGEIKLMDFNISRERKLGERPGVTSRMNASILGTVGYISPEQWSGKTVPASDIFSAGRLLWQLTTGIHPSETTNPLNFDVDPNIGRISGDPDLLKYITEDICNLEPTKRPTAEKARERLFELLGEPIEPLPVINLVTPVQAAATIQSPPPVQAAPPTRILPPPPVQAAPPTRILPPPPASPPTQHLTAPLSSPPPVGIFGQPGFAATVSAAENDIYINSSVEVLPPTQSLRKVFHDLEAQARQVPGNIALITNSLEGLTDVTNFNWRTQDIKRSADITAAHTAGVIINDAITRKIAYGYDQGWLSLWENILREVYVTSRFSPEMQGEMNTFFSTVERIAQEAGIDRNNPELVTNLLDELINFESEPWVESDPASTNRINHEFQVILDDSVRANILSSRPDQGAEWVVRIGDRLKSMPVPYGENPTTLPIVKTYLKTAVYAANISGINPFDQSRIINNLNDLRNNINAFKDENMGRGLTAAIDDALSLI